MASLLRTAGASYTSYGDTLCLPEFKGQTRRIKLLHWSMHGSIVIPCIDTWGR